MNLKAIRAQMGRGSRKIAKALGLEPKGPVSAVHGKPEGAKTIDRERTREAASSQPVLPRSHPLLEATPIRYPETWVHDCEGLKGYGPTISVVDSHDRLLGDVSVEWGRKANENWTFRRCCLPKPKKIAGRTLVLASTGGNTYFHWITDVLPRIRLARKAGHETDSFDHFLVNGRDQPFQKETLALFGVPEAKCLFLSGSESAYEFEEAGLPGLPGVPGVVPPESVQFLREQFTATNSGRPKKIFMGRGGARHRALIHEDEISRGLASKGFEAVECESLSVQKQAEAFASAEVVVGAHGAALANLVFCRPGTRVIELFSPRYVNPCYRDLCVAAGLKHAAMIGDNKDWMLSTRHDQPSAPITVSWELVEKGLQLVNGGL